MVRNMLIVSNNKQIFVKIYGNRYCGQRYIKPRHNAQSLTIMDERRTSSAVIPHRDSTLE